MAKTVEHDPPRHCHLTHWGRLVCRFDRERDTYRCNHCGTAIDVARTGQTALIWAVAAHEEPVG